MNKRNNINSCQLIIIFAYLTFLTEHRLSFSITKIMSQQALRNPKSAARTNYSMSSQFNFIQNKEVPLTRVKSPLTMKPSHKNQSRVSSNNYEAVTASSKPSYNPFDSSSNSNQQRGKQEKPSNPKIQIKQQKIICKKPSNQYYRFYGNMNTQSEESFMNSSMEQSGKMQRQHQIMDQFTRSKREIQDLLKRSREKRHFYNDHSELMGKGELNKNEAEDIRNQIIKQGQKQTNKQDKREEKRKKMQLYHCDSIIIKPMIKPVKVFELAISPTKHQPHKQQQTNQRQYELSLNNKSNYSIYNPKTINNHNQRYKQNKLTESSCSSRSSKRIHNPHQNKQNDDRFFGSFCESPLQNLETSNIHHLEMDSPSFFDEPNLVTLNHKQMAVPSNFNMNEKSLMKENERIASNVMQFDNSREDRHQSKLSNHSVASSKHSGNDKTTIASQQMIEVPRETFKKRNKIFGHEKKYGLKLSRAIRHEEQLSRLQEQLGVDSFHIIIEEDQFLRNCCT